MFYIIKYTIEQAESYSEGWEQKINGPAKAVSRVINQGEQDKDRYQLSGFYAPPPRLFLVKLSLIIPDWLSQKQ